MKFRLQLLIGLCWLGGVSLLSAATPAKGGAATQPDPVQVSVQKPLPDSAAAKGTVHIVGAMPQVRLTLDPDTVKIGDRFRLRIEITKDVMQQVVFPEFEKGRLADSIEIMQEGGIDTLRRDGRREVIAREYSLTCFTPGDYHLGKFPTLYVDKNLIDTIWSADSMRVVVRMPAVDTTKNTIYDIKPPMRIPWRWGEFGGYLVLGLLIALLVAMLIYWLVIRRGKSFLPGLGRKPIDPPHVEAIKRLEKLHDRKLWQSGHQKEYYTELTDILRAYMGRRFQFSAMEMTSGEILDKMRELVLDDRSEHRLKEVLSLADYVKFAKFEPDQDANESAYDDVYYFVEETKEQAPVEGNAPAVGEEPLMTAPKGAATPNSTAPKQEEPGKEVQS